jgi:hypothetical protein
MQEGMHLVVDLRPQKNSKLIIKQDVLLRIPIIQDAVRCYREIYEEKKTDCSNKSQHVSHQENISYLNPRT